MRGDSSRLVGILICIVIILSSGFSILSENARAQGTTSTLTAGFMGSIMIANPFVGFQENDLMFYGLIYDSLTTVDENMQVTPNLASSWWYMDGVTAASQPSPTNFADFSHNSSASDWPLGSIWEYNITSDVYWSDGVPLTAEDVNWTIGIQIGPNFMAYWAYQPYTFWIDDIQLVNDHKVRIFFAERNSMNPTPIAWGNCLPIPILPKHRFIGHSDIYIAQTWNGIPAIGTGPFNGTALLESEIIGGDHVTLVKNPFYNFVDSGDSLEKGLGHAYGRSTDIDQLNLKFYSENQALYLDLKTENIDYAKISPSTYSFLSTDPTKSATLQLMSTLSANSYSKVSHFNDFTSAPGALNPMKLDPAVQRAAALAINKTAIKDFVYQGLAVEGVGILSPAMSDWWWEPGNEISTFNVTYANGAQAFSYSKPMNEVMDYNITLANQILDAAGYIWTGSPAVRTVGQDAADRLVALGIVGNPSAVLGDSLIFSDIVQQESADEVQISSIIASDWEDIGIELNSLQVNLATWNALIYGYNYEFTESWWRGDWDPNYLLYIATTASIYGWNEFGTRDPVYDSMYLNQSIGLDPIERRHWVNECLEWQYLSGAAMSFTCYPKLCFGFSEKTWTGWGDWEAQPRLAMNIPWCENPLWFNLSPDRPPIATFTVAPAAGKLNTTFSVDASGCIDDVTPTISLEVRWDWKDNGTWTSWTTVKTAQHAFNEIGTFTIKLQVRDSDGLVNETTRIVRVSNTPPTTSATPDGTKGANNWYVSQINITLSVSSAAGISISWTRWRLDDGDWTNYTGKVNIASDGEHIFEYQSKDIAGNIESVKNKTLKIDKSAPTTTATTSGSTVTLSASDAGSGVNKTMISVNHGPFQEYVGPLTISSSSTVNNTVEYYSIDLAGNSEATKTVYVNIASSFNTMDIIWILIIIGIIAGITIPAIFGMRRKAK